MRRRTVLTGAAGLAAAAIGTGGAWLTHERMSAAAAPVVPDAPAGDERLESVVSAARGRTVDFYTAVPEGYGDGAGLPVCLVLHGGSRTAKDFAGLGFGRHLSAAVAAGAPPFVLAGATGDRLFWQPSDGDDPQRMLVEDIPLWCAARGFDTSRLAAWGWSMGGYGALLLAAAYPSMLLGVAAFSPAVAHGDAVFATVGQLRGTPIGLWCGRDDGLYRAAKTLEAALPEAKAAGGYGEGRHNFGYWSTQIPAAFAFLARCLSRPAASPAPGRASWPDR